MGFLAGAAVILTLFVILGFNTGAIAVIIGYALAAMLCLTEVFFLFFLFRLMIAERIEGVFTKIERMPGARFDTAFYSTELGELSNIFPCEFVMRDRFYKSGKKIRLKADRFGGKNRRVFDANARATIIAGNILCAPVPVLLLTIQFMKGEGLTVLLYIFVGLAVTLLAAGEIFYIRCFVRAMRARPVKASFTRIDTPEGDTSPAAFYMTEEGEFPALKVPGSGVRRAYTAGRQVTVRLDPPEREDRRVTDKNVMTAIIFWMIVSLPLPALLLTGLLL